MQKFAVTLCVAFALATTVQLINTGPPPSASRSFLTFAVCVGAVLMVSDDKDLAGEIVESVFDLTGRRLKVLPAPDGFELRFPDAGFSKRFDPKPLNFDKSQDSK